MVYKKNGIVINREIKNIDDVKEFALQAEWCRDKYNEYCRTHPCTISNGTMKTYKSQWRKANELFYDAYYELDEYAKHCTPEEFLLTFMGGK